MNNKTEHEVDLMKEAFEPVRKRVDIQAGGLVQHGNSIFRITEVLDFDSIIGVEVETGRSTPLRINELSPVVADNAQATEDIDGMLMKTGKSHNNATQRSSRFSP